MSPGDNYPQYLCTFCKSLLIKCSAFRDRCRRSQELMKYAEIKNNILTTSQIHTIAVSHHTALPLTISSPEITGITDIHIKSEELISEESQEPLKEEFTDDSDEEPLAMKVKNKVEIEVPDFNESSCNEFDESVDFDSHVKDVDDLKATMKDNIEVLTLSKEEQIQEVLARKESYNYLHSFYKCNYCYKGFIQDITYKNHMLRHDSVNGNEICEICHTRWPDIRSLKAHSSISHERRYICKLCDHKSKSLYRAKEHLKWHKGYKFICKLCGASFSKSTSHLTHLRTQHPSKYTCEVCGESFLGELGLRMHKKKSHRGYEKLNIKVHLKCKSCGIHFKCLDALKRHSGAFQDGVCDKDMSSCFQCGENLLTQDLLKEHMKTHDVAVRCEECNRNFAHERSFAVHYQRVHLGYRGAAHARGGRRRGACVCEICGKKCISNANLIYHQRIHTGEKPFHCSECPKKFSVFQRLQIHLRTHTGERPYKCSTCPKAFKHKAALNRHDRVHSGLKPYQCGHCSKTFTQSNSMKLHVKTVHLKMPAPYRNKRNNTSE